MLTGWRHNRRWWARARPAEDAWRERIGPALADEAMDRAMRRTRRGEYIAFFHAHVCPGNCVAAALSSTRLVAFDMSDNLRSRLQQA